MAKGPAQWTQIRRSIEEMSVGAFLIVPRKRGATAHCAAQRVAEYHNFQREFSTHRFNGSVKIVRKK